MDQLWHVELRTGPDQWQRWLSSMEWEQAFDVHCVARFGSKVIAEPDFDSAYWHVWASEADCYTDLKQPVARMVPA